MIRAFAFVCLIILAFSGCAGGQQEEPSTEAWSVDAVPDPDLPPVAEQEIMNRRIRYCQNKFPILTRAEARLACYRGYLAQPIPVQAEVDE